MVKSDERRRTPAGDEGSRLSRGRPPRVGRAVARGLLVALLVLAALFVMGADAGRALADDPTPTGTAEPTTPPPPTATTPPSNFPPIIINLPPAINPDLGGNNNAPQDNAAPQLIITGYQTNPSPVVSGKPFELTVTVKNVGTKHADNILASAVTNGSFVGLGAPVPLGQLDPGEAATFTLQVQAGTLSTGATDISVNFMFRVGEGPEQSTQRSMGLTVAGATGVSGTALVVVESAEVLSEPETLGETFDVEIVVRNTGTRKAFDVATTLNLNENLSPAQGSGTSQLGDLGPGEAVTVTLSLVLNKTSATGRIDQTFALDYRDSSNKAYSSDETVSLDLGTAGRRSPQLMVSAHTTSPEHPAPGEAFTLTLRVTNVGTGAARQVLARLGGEEGLAPFLPLGSSNVGYTAGIDPGESFEFSQRLLMEGDAAGGAYPLDVTLSYANSLGEPLTETEVIGLLTLARPQLQIDLTKELPEPAAVGETFDIAADIINLGRQRLEVTTVEVVSEDLALTKNSLYVGPLDPSISGGLTAKATAQTEGTAEFTVIIHYRDELNRMQTVEQTYAVEVGGAPQGALDGTPDGAAPQAANSGGWWAVLLQFLGLGGG